MKRLIFLLMLFPVVVFSQVGTNIGGGNDIQVDSVVVEETLCFRANSDGIGYSKGDIIVNYVRYSRRLSDGLENPLIVRYLNTSDAPRTIYQFIFNPFSIIGTPPPQAHLDDCYERNEYQLIRYCYTAMDSIKLTLDTIPSGNEIELQVLLKLNEAYPTLDTIDITWLDKNRQKIFYKNNMLSNVAIVFGEVPPLELTRPCVDSTFITNEVLTTSTDVASSKCYKFIANGTTDFFGTTLYYRVGETMIYDNLIHANITFPGIFDLTFEAYTNTDTDSTYFVNINSTELGEKPPKEDYISCESFDAWLLANKVITSEPQRVTPTPNTTPVPDVLPLTNNHLNIDIQNRTESTIIISYTQAGALQEHIVSSNASIWRNFELGCPEIEGPITITYLGNVGNTPEVIINVW